MVAGTIGSLTYLKQNYVKHHINDTHENLNWLKITKLHFTLTTKAQPLLIMMTKENKYVVAVGLYYTSVIRA